MNEKKNLDEGWPEEPANAALLRIAQQLPDVVAPLSADALARVRQQMQAEMDRVQRSQRRRRLVLGWSIAAAILIAIGSFVALHRSSAPDSVTRIEPPLIEDRIVIAVGDVGPISGKPLLALDDYHSLYAD